MWVRVGGDAIVLARPPLRGRASLWRMSAPLSLSRWSALVVDGDGDVRKVMRLVLEWAGACVLEVGSGAAALAAIEHGRFDAICLDLSLGDVTGLTLLPELRRRQPEAGVIAISEATEAAAIVAAVQAGAMAYLTKPFTRDELRSAASAVLDQATAAPRQRRRSPAGAATSRASPPRARPARSCTRSPAAPRSTAAPSSCAARAAPART